MDVKLVKIGVDNETMPNVWKWIPAIATWSAGTFYIE
jgi:hypothetical protein